MSRGEIWSVAGGRGYAGKPRPAVIVQDDAFDGTASVTICPFTSDPADAPLIRLPISPNDMNGLDAQSRVMIDKVVTVSRAKLGYRIGRLDDHDLVRLNRALLVFLGLSRPVRGP